MDSCPLLLRFYRTLVQLEVLDRCPGLKSYFGQVSSLKIDYHWDYRAFGKAHYDRDDRKLCEVLLSLAQCEPLATPTISRFTENSGKAYHVWYYVNLSKRLLSHGLHKSPEMPAKTGITETSTNAYYDKAYIKLCKGQL